MLGLTVWLVARIPAIHFAVPEARPEVGTEEDDSLSSLCLFHNQSILP